ncbi:hypothetical protein B0H11DRAFT_2071820 [Mycena galericulata]|nr:hypothetical protein B0H11DRAFT_2071820 [Mycena galericulata]
MDSQLTLVPTTPSVYLSFSHNSMKNATLFLGATPVYTISTDPQVSSTEIRASGTSELLAHIATKPILPDTIAFPGINGGKEIRLTKWSRKSKLPDGSSIHIISTDHGNFFLKIHPVHRLALFREDDPETPVAHWQYPMANNIDNELPLPTLILTGAIRDADRAQVIAAFIVREFRVRMKEEASRVTLMGPGVIVAHP